MSLCLSVFLYFLTMSFSLRTFVQTFPSLCAFSLSTSFFEVLFKHFSLSFSLSLSLAFPLTFSHYLSLFLAFIPPHSLSLFISLSLFLSLYLYLSHSDTHGRYPAMTQATPPSFASNRSSHTVPHCIPSNSSILPLPAIRPPPSRILASRSDCSVIVK